MEKLFLNGENNEKTVLSIISLAFIATLAMSLAACGSDPKGQTSYEAPTETSAPTETETMGPSEIETEAESSIAEADWKEVWKEFSFMNMSKETAEKLGVDIYILAGQSNASGCTNIDKSVGKDRDKNTYNNVLLYFVRRLTDETTTRDFQFVPVKEGLGQSEGQIGPELGMASYLAPLYQDGSRIALILKVASGSTSLCNAEPEVNGVPVVDKDNFQIRGSWLPTALDPDPDGDYFRPTGFMTREFKTHLEACYGELLAAGIKAENIDFKAFCWSQGENDRGASHLPVYVDYFKLLVEEVRTLTTNVSGKDYSKLPVVLNEASETFSSAYNEDLEKNQKLIAV